MKITDIRINGIETPIGFQMDYVKCSWKVTEAVSLKAAKSRVEVYDEEGVLLDRKEGELDSAGTLLDIELMPRKRYTVKISVQKDAGGWAENETYFVTGKCGEGWQAKWIGKQKEDQRFPKFFKKLEIRKEIKAAYLHICGLGLFEAYLNGEKIGEEYLTPYLSEYRSVLQSITFDVRKLLERGENKLEVLLGEGWYMGRFGGPKGSRLFGDHMALIAELNIEYADGSRQLETTDETWKYEGSSITQSNIYDGEDIDGLLYENTENEVLDAVVLDDGEKPQGECRDRISLCVKAKEYLSVSEVIRTPLGDTVLDFGQNHSGWVEFECREPKGTVITLDFGEVLQNGEFYNENYRSARARFTYISDGKVRRVRPHFTYFGFRYVKISGISKEPDPRDFVSAVLYSDIERTGYFECGNKKINRLYENTLWGLKSNFIDMPTDCPQRDERLGWTGDAQIFSNTACMHMNAKVFYDKFLTDLREYQKKRNGAVPASIPQIEGMDVYTAVWGDAAVIIPMNLYRIYKDRELLSKEYPMMKDWVEYVTALIEQEHPRSHLWDFGFQFGDWLALDGENEQSVKGGTEDCFVASAYYYNSLKQLAEAADILGNSCDAQRYRRLSKEVRNELLDLYFAPSGRMCVDTQSSYILALQFGIYRDKEVLKKYFRIRLSKDHYEIRCGFVGAPLICSVLADNGMEEEAFRILFREEFPSWLYAVNLGATTVWERWNSLLEDGSISGTDMNSLNHYSYGSVAQFLYQGIGGISLMSYGYKTAVIEPKIDIRLKYADVSFDSVYGKYRCRWEVLQNGDVKAEIEIPFGCSAVVRLPRCAEGEWQAGPGTHTVVYTPTVSYLKKELDALTVREIWAEPKIKQFIAEHAYPLMALIESGGEQIMDTTVMQAIETAAAMCGLEAGTAQAVKEKISQMCS